MKILFYNGSILTLADPLYAEAVLVEDEKILAVGREAELRSIAGECEEVDLGGATMLPGFIDPHSHISSFAATYSQACARGIDNYEDLKAMVQKYIRDNNIPKGEWVIVRAYDHTIFPGGKYLTLDEIDAIAPDHLLEIRHSSGHAGLFNSRLMEHFGVTVEMAEQNPEEILMENGKLTGCFKEGAFSSRNAKVPGLPIEQICAMHPKLQRYYAENGITTAQEGFLSSRTIDLYRDLYESGNLMLDIIPYAPLRFYELLLEKYKTLPAEHDWHFGGIKYFLDGSPQLRTAWTREPYLGGNTCGLPIHTDEEVIEAFRFAADHHVQIITHTNGDAAAAQFLRCLEVVEKEKPWMKDLRPVLIHGQLMGRDQLAKAAELGVIVSFFVAHCYHFADTHLRNLGPERGMYVSPVNSAIKSGVCVTFHQDAPVIEPDMLETIWCATNRITRNGVQLAEDECISVLDAIRAVTINAAYQYFEEDKKGTIEAGKLADMIILDKDPLAIDKKDIREIQILKTYKKGKCIFEKETV